MKRPAAGEPVEVTEAVLRLLEEELPRLPATDAGRVIAEALNNRAYWNASPSLASRFTDLLAAFVPTLPGTHQ